MNLSAGARTLSAWRIKRPGAAPFSLVKKRQRRRSQGLWALIIGCIGLGGCLLGSIQYWRNGVVPIRPGHDPASGREALELVIFLGLISAIICVIGIFILRCSRSN